MLFPVSSVIPALVSQLAQAEPPKVNWKLANRFTAESLTPFVPSTTLSPGWINKTDTFWYVWRDDSGRKFWKVDPKAKKKTPLFDTAKMAALLSELTQKPYDSTNLPFTTVTFDEKDTNRMFFSIIEAPVAPSTTPKTTRYEYDLAKETLKVAPKEGAAAATTEARDFRNLSPDKKAYVYALAHNLYYVEIKEGKDQPPVQLTKDGEKDYSFGSREGGFGGIFGGGGGTRRGQQGGGAPPPPTEQRVRANVTWSKDSKRFYVSRSDSRKVKELYLVSSLAEPRPALMSYKYAMPGEPEVGSQELFAFNPEKKVLEKLPVEKYKDQQIRNLHFQDTTSETLRFVRRDRLQRHAELCEINLATKTVTPLVTETVANAFLELQEVKYVKPGGDFLWFSERSGWGHYYLYSNDGKLKNAVTSGPYRASSITEVDEKKSQLWFVGQGREAGENPYYQHLYRVGLDGSDLALTDSGEAEHTSSVSPSKDFVVDVSSRPDLPPKAVLRDREGKLLMDLEESKLERLLELGWRMPERFMVKAADGVNDLYGNLWKPTDFDPKRKYPIIAYVYPGPQTESVNSGFSVSATNARMAQLGFIVIQIGNRGGNPARSNAYHSYGYYNLRDYGLADKKTGIEQLAARFPWVDIDKVGIFGHSGGGFMTGAALLMPPYNEFFKVGVSSAGNHDNNIYNANWSEQHHGLKEVPVLGADGKPTGETKFEIKVPTNAELAGNLKGKLLLVHGEVDNNVHPGGTIRLVNALIKAGKRFDFMMLPGQTHSFGDMTGYFNQMTLEYFAEHLLGDYQRGNAEMKVK
ncbi:DPP IV N-terminal domain-containing protein [Armatimonas sp.]|uniref:S9 family peptidase n=1 Tax=Armatimonas sp. TaxID=1872638 RepID=UPI00286D2BE7|nr:DPP IV N-terminal domain-containing protein [Armatimonas sp.]